MLIECGLCSLLLLLSSATGNIETNGLIMGKDFDRSVSFSHWPSLLNGASMWRIRKRELQEQVGPSEGDKGNSQAVPSMAPAASSPAQPSNPSSLSPTLSAENKTKHIDTQSDGLKVTVNATQNNIIHINTSVPMLHVNDTKNETMSEGQTDKMDLSSPGVVKRGVIVFGGFALLAVAYFIFYRRKGSKNDASTSHSSIDANQFRYGVLQSDDRRDNLELSRIPLTMESDEDEDDDLEIFDLEQKRKSMSYVNLQVNDEEIVNGPKDSSEGNDRDNLLLDIEDANSDALINWSSNGNKSII